MTDTINNNQNTNTNKYNKDLLITFLASLRTKPFVILTGMSGTGKTSLVENFVEDLYPNKKSKYYEFVPVKPNWTDSNPLLGFYNPLIKEFIPGKLTKIITKSYGDKTNPYFILLDEINLARVEYYLAELLSLMETIKDGESNFLPLFTFSDNEFDTTKEKERFIAKLYNNGLLIKDDNGNILVPGVNEEENKENQDEKEKTYEAGYKISNNLFIIGTANIDETTYGFSNKVLDRCNVIEVENTLGVEGGIEFNDLGIDNNKIKNFLINKGEINEENIDENFKNFYKEKLGKEQNLYSHRVYNDILRYLDSIKELNIKNEKNYYLYPILQKVLPKIKGIGGKDSETYQILDAIKNKMKDKNNASKIIKKINQMQKGDFITFWK